MQGWKWVLKKASEANPILFCLSIFQARNACCLSIFPNFAILLCLAQTTFSFVLTRYLCKFLFMGHIIIIYQIWNFNPLTPKISLVILCIVWHVIFMMLVWRIGVGSTNNPLIYIFLYSHNLLAWYCIDIVRRNSVLVTHGKWNHFVSVHVGHLML